MSTIGSEFKTHGVTAETPKHVLMGAGTIHRGLTYDADTGMWNFSESLVGATSGGNKFDIIPVIDKVEIDGVYVDVVGLEDKHGETATIEVSLIELSPKNLKAALLAKDGISGIEGYNLIESKPRIEAGDYWENVAFVGKTISGAPIIIILDNALCTSGISVEGKSKEGAVPKCVFRCTQLISGDLTTLPYHIYYPTPVVAGA